MNRTAAIEAARWSVIASGSDVSVRSVQAECVRIFGHKFRNAAVLSHLKAVTLGEHISNGAVTLRPHEKPQSGNTAGTGGKPSRKARGSQRSSKPLPNGQDSHPETNVSGAAGIKPADPQWVLELREAVIALQGRSLAQLDADERFIVARHHAVVFGHCRSVERTNRAKSRGVVTSLTNLRDYLERNKIELTVRGYFTLAKRFHEKIGGGVWLTPADVRAEGEAV